MIRLPLLASGLLLLLAAQTPSIAQLPVTTRLHATAGETHRSMVLASAAARRSDHQPKLDITIWYPASAAAQETLATVGPPDAPLFEIAPVAAEAAPVPGRHPVILMSHGFGGTAQDMGWLAAPFARAGYVVIAVDHPGNNALDKTLVGATAWWERPRDLIAAFSAISRDPTLGLLVDRDRVGAAGYSMGGATALALAGARIDPYHLDRFCAAHRSDGVCQPPAEMPNTPVDMKRGIAMLGLEASAAHAGVATTFPHLKAVLSIAPNAQTLDDDSLQRIAIPVVLIAGDADTTVPIAHQAGYAAHAIKGAKLLVVPGASHYSFMATCTAQGRVVIDVCRSAKVQSAAHATAIDAAIALFRRTLSLGL